MSHISFTYHIVFGTYKREQVIHESDEKLLYKFIYNFSVKRGVFVRRIGGMPDHIHILCDIPPTMAIADFVRILKAESSKFMKASGKFPHWKRWAAKYGGFCVDASSREVRRQYIMHQKEHHRGVDFASEYRQLLDEAGYPPNTAILGDDADESIQ
ncbi:MAG: IS200/IS605 family transposase [Muribaculaceae bacterium]|nr:IS200/IS605 family transposase [Muribaculaceae bacterium]